MKITEELLTRWENLKDEVLYELKHISGVKSALSAFGLDKELHEDEMGHKYRLIDIEDKWDFKFGCWLDIVENCYYPYNKVQLVKIANNFTSRFKSDIINSFPVEETKST